MAWLALLLVGAGIIGLLGTLHLLYTFFSHKFDPYDRTVITAMQGTNPRLTRDTTMWQCWIGFNASHSLGAILLTAVYVPLALFYPAVLRESVYFTWLPVAFCAIYAVLAYRYWFKIPLTGLVVAGACFVVSAFS